MNDYSFENLNDKEFEVLIADLMTLELGRKVERFKVGKDGGVDGRFFTDGNESILQCKHWLKSKPATLIKELKNVERNKISKLKPDNYLFFTSLKLSRKNKTDIKEALSPFVKEVNWIYGNEDINDLLKKYPEVERRHYKLWISTTTVMLKVFNEAIYGRSLAKVKGILEKTKLYVQTEKNNEALKMLSENNTLIISGEPGSGKTTLAENLAAHYVKKGFAFFLIEKEFEEAESIYSEGDKQVFYFDDFLGRNYLEAIEGRTDSQVCNFIARIRKNKNKRFILTSRTSILNRGISLSDLLNENNIKKSELEIKIDGVLRIEKARILYNHLWFSNLGENFISILYHNKNYKVIIDHRNFNPRLINYITNYDRFKGVEPIEYWNSIKEILNNPKDVWAVAFKSQIDQSSRDIVSLVAFNGKKLGDKRLRFAFHKLRKDRKSDSLSYEDACVQMIGAMLNREISKEHKIRWDLFNPSIGDYIYRYFKYDEESIFNFINCLRTYSSLNVVLDLKRNNLLEPETATNILKRLFSLFLAEESEININLIILICYELMKPEYIYDKKQIADLVFKHAKSFEEIDHHSIAIKLFVELLEDSRNLKNKNSLHQYIKFAVDEVFEDEFNDLYDLASLVSVKMRDYVEKMLLASLIERMKSDITDDAYNSEIFSGADPNETYDYQGHVEDFIRDQLSEFKFSYTEENVSRILAKCDFDEIAEKIISSSYYDNDDERYYPRSDESDDKAIEDLFSEDIFKK